MIPKHNHLLLNITFLINCRTPGFEYILYNPELEVWGLEVVTYKLNDSGQVYPEAQIPSLWWENNG